MHRKESAVKRKLIEHGVVYKFILKKNDVSSLIHAQSQMEITGQDNATAAERGIGHISVNKIAIATCINF